jgi:predicted AAA+ superfamily ATPase
MDFSLEVSLRNGHLPSLFSENKDPNLYLESYIETYLREEVQQEGITRNLGVFSRFLETASFSQGSVLNISEVARDCALERRTVSNYFQILEDLLIATRVPVFSKRAKRRLIAHNKFYFVDVGIFKTIRPSGPLDSPEEIAGAALETLVFQELRAINEYYRLEYSLYFWRTNTGVEVDFILYGPRGIIAVEVKHRNRITARETKSLRIFKNDYPEAKCYLFYMGNRKEYYDDIEVISVEAALRNLPSLL